MNPDSQHGTQAWPQRVITFAMAAILLASAGCASHRHNRVSFEPSAQTPGIWPITGANIRITSRFGDHVSTGHGTGHTHCGIDFAAPKGTPVIATADGTVVCAENTKRAYGRIVKLAHPGGIETWYAHLSAIETSVGKRVRRGQCIGKVGMTGRATGNHLHYEVHVNGAPVNPERYLPASSRR